VTVRPGVLRAAAVQLTARADPDDNVAAAERFVGEAAREGARFVVLPEKWPLLEATPANPAQPLDGPWLSAARSWARSLDIWLLAGSILEAVPAEDRAFNTSVLISPDGTDAARYRKLHLFDVEVGGHAYRESDGAMAGDALATSEVDGFQVGLGICYDLRFPELFRAMTDIGTDLVALPAAFTATTGRDHWEVLLRARAIENQVFVVAANQVGRHPNGTSSHGHSMIIDPWGRVLAEASDGPGVVVADLDLGQLREIRKRLPALSHRRRDVLSAREGVRPLPPKA
jgi:deaminated glutathione amidase